MLLAHFATQHTIAQARRSRAKGGRDEEIQQLLSHSYE